MTQPLNPYQSTQQMSPSDEKLWATLVHVGGIVAGFLPALVGYIVLKDRGPFIRHHAATALNFQITLAIVYVAGFVLSLVFVGILVVIAAQILAIIFSIIAAIAANQGQFYSYPLTIKFVS